MLFSSTIYLLSTVLLILIICIWTTCSCICLRIRPWRPLVRLLLNHASYVRIGSIVVYVSVRILIVGRTRLRSIRSWYMTMLFHMLIYFCNTLLDRSGVYRRTSFDFTSSKFFQVSNAWFKTFYALFLPSYWRRRRSPVTTDLICIWCVASRLTSTRRICIMCGSVIHMRLRMIRRTTGRPPSHVEGSRCVTIFWIVHIEFSNFLMR